MQLYTKNKERIRSLLYWCMKQMELNILLNISFLYPLCYILLSFVDIQLKPQLL